MNFIRFSYIFLLFFVQVSFSQDFLRSFGDVPLFPEIVIDSGSALSFEEADGRIAEVRGHSSSSFSDMVDFYRGSLPSLGWVELEVLDNSLYFIRDGEVLRIEFMDNGEVLFRLAPEV